MKLYDKLIGQIKNLLPENAKRFSYSEPTLKIKKDNSILLLKETAYELGGSQKPCVSTVAVSDSIKFDNCTYLYGKDIPEIRSDCCFGKIVFLEIKDIGEEQSAFDKIKELERLKYSFCPEEFMTRASAFNMREQIRVSKKAVKNGVTFSDYGSSLIKAYLEFPMVKSVQIIFITDFDRFNELGMICDKVRQTTDALNHILDNVLLDCNTCNLKSICDEVEGMKELHMKNAAKKKDFLHTLIIPGSGHTVKNSKMQDLQHFLDVDLTRVLHRLTVPMH